jgi:hypothetical protein
MESGKSRKKKDRHDMDIDAPVKIKGLSIAPKKEEEDDSMDRPRVRILEEQAKKHSNQAAATRIKQEILSATGETVSNDDMIPSQDAIGELTFLLGGYACSFQAVFVC